MVKYNKCYLSAGMLYKPFPFESKLLFSVIIADFPYALIKYREETRREAALCGAAQWVA